MRFLVRYNTDARGLFLKRSRRSKTGRGNLTRCRL